MKELGLITEKQDGETPLELVKKQEEARISQTNSLVNSQDHIPRPNEGMYPIQERNEENLMSGSRVIR